MARRRLLDEFGCMFAIADAALFCFPVPVPSLGCACLSFAVVPFSLVSVCLRSFEFWSIGLPALRGPLVCAFFSGFVFWVVCGRLICYCVCSLR